MVAADKQQIYSDWLGLRQSPAHYVDIVWRIESGLLVKSALLINAQIPFVLESLSVKFYMSV
jgi:hypothetical protein